MFKLIFSRYFLLWLIISLWIWYYFFIKPSTTTLSLSQTESTYEKVLTWSVEDTISAVWTVELVDEQSLKFNKQWTIVRVNVKEWDKVKKWDVIAELDNKEQNYKIQQSQISLDNAKIKLKQLYDSVDNSQLLSSLKSIEDTKNNISIANKQLESLKKEQINSLNEIENNQITSEKDLEASNISLNNALKDLEITKSSQSGSFSDTTVNINSSIVKSEESIKNYITDIEKNLEETDYLFWITEANKDKNNSFEDYLSADDVSFRSNAKDLYIANNTALVNLKVKIDKHTYWKLDELIIIYNDLIAINKNLYSMSDNTYSALENSIENVYFTSTTISTKKATFNSFKSTSNSDILSINTILSSLETLTDTDLLAKTNEYSITKKEENISSLKLSIEKKENDLMSLKNNYDQTKTSYDIKLESQQNSINILNKTLEVNNESLKELQDWPTTENVLQAQNNISQAEISLEEAREGLKDYDLTAPFAWVIKTLNMKVGDNLTTDNDRSIYIENPDLIEIKIMLDQVDVVKVKVWDKARITFDSYSDTPVTWELTYINTTPTSTSWVVSYEVKLVVSDKTFSKKILSWMTADIQIVVKQNPNAILISTSAIKTESWSSYVDVKTSSWTEKRIIKTWLISWEKTEVIEWLKVWEEIILVDASILTASWTTKSSSLFWNFWAWWRKSSSTTWNSSQQDRPPMQ